MKYKVHNYVAIVFSIIRDYERIINYMYRFIKNWIHDPIFKIQTFFRYKNRRYRLKSNEITEIIRYLLR
jgi:hypothetical protein